MPAKVHTSKVLCYIVRDGQLLVFRHADYDPEHVGIQVPAGSIRHGESPEAAALREAREETGLSQFSIVACPIGRSTPGLRSLADSLVRCANRPSEQRVVGSSCFPLPGMWRGDRTLPATCEISQQAYGRPSSHLIPRTWQPATSITADVLPC